MLKLHGVIRLRPVVAAGLCVALLASVGALGGLARSAGEAEKKRPVYSVDTDKPHAALGINCAWGNEDIPEIIKALDTGGVKATFFVAGSWCDRYPASVRALYNAGHEIASHSNSHANLTRLDDAGVQAEIRKASSKLEAVTGEPVTLFRLPSGAYDSRVIALIEGEGLIPIQWNCDSLDYLAESPGEILARVEARLEKGAITLFHSGTEHTAEALPMVFDAAKAKGISFVPVSRLIYPAPYTVDYEGKQRALSVGSAPSDLR
jgi:peptidoglycan/xylan/chitin deacetylase (PgdA/CDA1 family)